MKPDKEMRTQQSVLNLSTQRLVILTFAMFYIRHMLSFLYIFYNPQIYLNYTWLLALPPSPANPISWGPLIKSFFVWDLVPLLLFAIALSKYANKKMPKISFHYIIGALLSILCTYIIYNMISNTFFVSVNLGGYVSRGANLLLYCLISMYLLYQFHSESMWKVFLIVVLGVLVVGELWELPLSLLLDDRPLIIFAIRYLQRYIPLFLWFHMFRGVYHRVIVDKWYLVLPLIFTISLLTVLTVTHYPLPIHNLFKGFFLRLSYAFLLIFLPFHHLTQKR